MPDSGLVAFHRLPRVLRYFYYLISGFRLRSYGAWKRDGEPNPFARSRPVRKETTRPEIADIFRMTEEEAQALLRQRTRLR